MAEEVDETKRRSRNLSEKKRRDQFNMLVNELSTMVTTNGRKMDKSTVLKSAITFLKNHNESAVRSRVDDIQEEWKPPFLSNVEFTKLILDALDGFIVVFSATGHINFVSESVTSLLGYLPSDIMNKSIFDLAYEEDRPSLYSLLQNPGTSVDSVQAVILKENQIEFQCHIRRGSLDYREEPTYELVHFIGYFRSNVDHIDVEGTSSPPQNRDNKLLFVCTGRLMLPQLIRDMSPAESEQCEFTSRHSLEWKYLFLDHRAPAIIGYLPFEVLGTSGYDYYHLDDLEKVATCHEALMEKGELTSCYYRFLTKGQQWIWLQTRFYITYHQWNSKPEFVVCTHRVVSYADVIIKSEDADGVDNPGAGNFSTLGDAVTEADVSMGDVSPSYVSESSDDYDRRLMSHAGSVQSMSTGSGADGSVGPASARAANMAASSAPSSDTSQVSQYQGSSWTRAARLRYGSSESGSTPSGSVCARRRHAHDPGRGSGSDNMSACHYLEAVHAPAYAVSVPLVVSPVQVQIQLQRKHEELQQLIVMQQEELRRIAEQLVMARLGMLPQVQYGENMVMNGGPPQIMYEVPPSYAAPLALPPLALPPPALHQPMLPSPLPAILPAVLPPPARAPLPPPPPEPPQPAQLPQEPEQPHQPELPDQPHNYRRHMPQ